MATLTVYATDKRDSLPKLLLLTIVQPLTYQLNARLEKGKECKEIP